MDIYIVSITVIGIAALAMAWMPDLTRKTRVSYAIIYVLFGVILFSVLKHLPLPNPFIHNDYTVRLTEMVVIVSLMGTGLKIDQPFSFKTWAAPFRLVTIAMIICIGAVTLITRYLFHFDWASALLLGAVLAPTDPVLASDVQVGPPLEESRDKARFTLTAEAGMNDGMAFPFTWLVVVIAMQSTSQAVPVTEWVLYYFLYKIVAGVAIGFGIGKLLAYLLFYLPGKKKLVNINDGFVAISTTLVVYGTAELLHGYGFISVFVAAITLRNYELNHKLHKKLHSFADQVERILLAIVLIAFGGSIASGLLSDLDWKMALFGLGFLFIIRPLAGLASLLGLKLHSKEKLAISFFGIRGIGSFYYIAFALKQTTFLHGVEIWNIVAFIVLISILVHGATASIAMTKLDDIATEK